MYPSEYDLVSHPAEFLQNEVALKIMGWQPPGLTAKYQFNCQHMPIKNIMTVFKILCKNRTKSTSEISCKNKTVGMKSAVHIHIGVPV